MHDYSNGVAPEIELFKCTAFPSASIADLLAGAWGCQPIANQTFNVGAVANIWSAEQTAVSNEGRDTNVWYVGYSYGSNVDPSYSQVMAENMRAPS